MHESIESRLKNISCSSTPYRFDIYESDICERLDTRGMQGGNLLPNVKTNLQPWFLLNQKSVSVGGFPLMKF